MFKPFLCQIVEELEDRLRDKMEEVLLLVKNSLLEVPVNGVNSEDGPDAEGEWDVADDRVEIVQEIA
ncbi:MAG TPA: hypothetical protein VGO47_02635, partial [Chlamydiales bacterium]|nr:hypothetical protein [Chlamydiales bacterium]